MDSLKQPQPLPPDERSRKANNNFVPTARRVLRCLRAARHAVLLGTVVLAACTRSQPPPSPDLAAQLGPDAPLLPLFRALAAQQAHSARRPLVILQIGDSHTANDSFSGRLRDLFQARFGDAGRGILPPGVPYRYYRPARVSVTSHGWTVASSFHPATPGPFGITGLRQHADHVAEMTLTAPAPGDMAKIEIELLRQPGGGAITATTDTGANVTTATAAPSFQPVWLPVPANGNTHTVSLRADGNGPVDVLAWRIARDTPGVIYANLGTIGATVDIMNRWDPAIVHQELAHLAPTMIVVAFGTNEGFRDSTDPAAYASEFADRLQALHQAAPGAALLVLGPIDGDRRRPNRSAEPPACGDPHWTQPPRLDEVRAIQRSVAAQNNAYFWNWYQAMGGACSMMRWTQTDPPMAAPDHVHLFAPGYQATADILFRTLMTGYAHYRALLPAG